MVARAIPALSRTLMEIPAVAKEINDSEMYSLVCKRRFDELDEKLDMLLKTLVVGNGQPSLVVRVDRLEQCKQSTSKALWVAVTAFITAVAGAIWEMFFQKS